MAERSHENVKLLQSALGVRSSLKNHSGKIAELAAEDGALYQGSARQIFWSGGCKNFVLHISPEIAGFGDTGNH